VLTGINLQKFRRNPSLYIFEIDPEEDGGGKQLRNVCTFLPDHTASHTFIVTAERTSNLTPTTA
jgi:hypothetical protein